MRLHSDSVYVEVRRRENENDFHLAGIISTGGGVRPQSAGHSVLSVCNARPSPRRASPPAAQRLLFLIVVKSPAVHACGLCIRSHHWNGRRSQWPVFRRSRARRAQEIRHASIRKGASRGRGGHLLFAALLAGGCSTTKPQSVPYAATPVGTTWAAQVTSSGSFGSGTTRVTTRAGERTWEGQRVLTHESPAGTMMTRPSDGLRIGFLGPDGKPQFLLSPPVGPQFPLERGKAWTTSTMMTLYPSGNVVPVESEWKVHDFEELTVPAGTFRALRFTLVDRVRGAVWNEDSYWLAPELNHVVKVIQRRAASHPLGIGVRESALAERPKAP